MKLYWLVIPALSLMSCFETVEEINLKADGSGTFNYIVNMSQSRAEISAALKLDSFMGTRIPSLNDVKANVAEAKRRLQSSPGISQVEVLEDYQNYIIQVKGHFTSLDQLNKAAKDVSVQMGADEEVMMGSFNYAVTDSSFNRVVSVELEPRWIKWAENLLGQMATKATYTCVVKSEKQALSVSNASAKISPSGKAVMLRTNAHSVIHDPTVLNLLIRYK